MFQLITIFILAGLLTESTQQTCTQDVNIRCWTEWFDRDDPSGTGDWETLMNLRDELPGKICPTPLAIEVVTTTGVSMAEAGEVIAAADTTTGFVCKIEDQPDKACLDYRVRFGCHPPFCDNPICWTEWFDRDNPTGTGDWESLDILKNQYPGVICEKPLYVEAVTVDTLTPALATGQNIFLFNPTSGFVCRNSDQANTMCLDYKVRFGCQC
ncbi:unnamed protein product [Lota lota]